jgi:molecular chaperone DnaK
VTVDDLVPGNRGATVPWRYRMTRTELEWASLPLVERTFAVCKEALESADLQPAELERVILVGGATRMPLVGRKAEQFFGRAPVVRINPDEVVALGAAIQASLLDPNRRRTGHPLVHPRVSDESLLRAAPRDDAPVLEPIPLPLVGPKDLGAPLAGAAAFLPGVTSKPLVFEASPEPAAAPPPSDAAPSPPLGLRAANSPPPVPKRTQRGAAPATVTGQAPPQPRPRAPTMPFPFETAPSPGPPRPAPLLIDVTPLSLSVETVGGYCDVLIDANTPVPCDRTRSFATASEGQTSVKVRVAQGPSRRFEENTCLGEVELSGLAPAARGEVQIAVTFEIDADGILNVRARDVRSGQEGRARLQLVGAGAPEDVERMKERQSTLPIG